jgi:hypothetical protein
MATSAKICNCNCVRPWANHGRSFSWCSGMIPFSPQLFMHVALVSGYGWEDSSYPREDRPIGHFWAGLLAVFW